MILIDVRTPEEYQSGSVPSAINLPLDRIVEGEMPSVELSEKIVVFCRSGARSEQAKSILEMNGFANVTNGGGVHDVNH